MYLIHRGPASREMKVEKSRVSLINMGSVRMGAGANSQRASQTRRMGMDLDLQAKESQLRLGTMGT